MSKRQNLKICNWTLLVIGIVLLASGIQLEVTHGQYAIWVIVHVITGIAMLSLVLWHLQLNFGRFNRLKNLWGKSKTLLKWLAATGLLAFITGIACTPFWILHGHAGLGGVHGKLGFLFIIICIIHAIKHLRYYKSAK